MQMGWSLIIRGYGAEYGDFARLGAAREELEQVWQGASGEIARPIKRSVIFGGEEKDGMG